MTTPARGAAEAKARLQQHLVDILRKGDRYSTRISWGRIATDPTLWQEVVDYDLHTPQRQSWLSKIAFPDCYPEDVNAALNAGNNVRRLYDIARGAAHIERDSAGDFVKGKKGLRIIDV